MATIIQTPITEAKFFVVIELDYDNEVIPATGYETHYDKMIAWCSKNISGKWYSGKMQQLKYNIENPSKSYVGTEDVAGMAIFNFEDSNDKAHFILKWL